MAEIVENVTDMNEEKASTSGEPGLKKTTISYEEPKREQSVDHYNVKAFEYEVAASDDCGSQRASGIDPSQCMSVTEANMKQAINSETDQLPEQDVISSQNCVLGSEFFLKQTIKSRTDQPLEKDTRNPEYKSSIDEGILLKINVGTIVDDQMIHECETTCNDVLQENRDHDGNLSEFSTKQFFKKTIDRSDDQIRECVPKSSNVSHGIPFLDQNKGGDVEVDRINCNLSSRLTVNKNACLHVKLDQLPFEVLMHICSFLDARFIIQTMTKVCHTFQQLFLEDIYWKTRISKRWPKKYPPVHIDDFDWTEACIEREERYRIWSNPDTYMDHFTYNEGLFAPVDAVHLMQGGKLLASGSRDRYLTLLDVTKYNSDDPASKKEMKVHSDSKAHKGWIWSLASTDGILATGSWDTYIKLWDLHSNCTEISKFKCRSAILDLYMEPGLIVAGGYDKQVYQIDPREGSVRHKKIHNQPILCIAVDDNYIITGSEDKTVAIFDRRSSEVFKTLEVESFVMDMCFAEGQLWLGDKKGNAHLYDATHGRFDFVQKYHLGHTGKLTGIIYTLGALYTCSTDHTIIVSEPNLSPAQMCTLKTHDGAVAQIAFQNGVLASAGSDISIGIWRPKIYN